ncbi:MAG: hypothetical protein RLZZ387_2103 [Chloroflexota bacterium]
MMNIVRRHLPLATLAAAALALALLAMGLGGIELQPGKPFALSGPSQGGGGGGGASLDIRLVLVAFIWICLIVSVIGLIVSPSLRRQLLRAIPVYLVWGLLIYLALSWLYSQAMSPGAPPAAPPLAADNLPQPPPEVAPAVPPAFVSSPPQWLVLAVSLAVGLLAVAAVWLVARAARRPRPESQLAQLARGAQSALIGIESGEGLRNAVLRCYAEMSQVLAEQRGVQRDKTVTPREFETRLIAAGLRDEHIRRLTRLFESVRYGSREPGPREEREAVACLQAIVEAYGRPKP